MPAKRQSEYEIPLIIQAVRQKSYSLVGEQYGLTRNQVAGIIWRHKNPPRVRIYKKGKNGKKNGGMCGRGRHGCGPYPPLTVANTR